jgi:hypothetical protein
VFPEDILASDIGRVPSLLSFAGIGIFFYENIVTKNKTITFSVSIRIIRSRLVLGSMITKIDRVVIAE